MRSFLTQQMLNTFQGMSKRERDEAISTLICEYAKESVDNTTRLLALIPEISRTQVKLLSDKCTDNYQAAEWLMNIQEISPEKIDDPQMLAMMVPICKVMFPNGTCGKSHSKVRQQFFAKFLKLYKKEFDWQKDRSWAEQFGYKEYLTLIDKNLREGEI